MKCHLLFTVHIADSAETDLSRPIWAYRKENEEKWTLVQEDCGSQCPLWIGFGQETGSSAWV